MRKVTTGCCAMAQLDRVNDLTPKDDIKRVLDKLSFEMRRNTEVGVTTGNGQTAVFTIVSPGENILEFNLKELGFVYTHSFPRRVGYPVIRDEEGDVKLLKMYIKNLD